MPLLILNLGCENVKYPARKHFEKTNNYTFHHRRCKNPQWDPGISNDTQNGSQPYL